MNSNQSEELKSLKAERANNFERLQALIKSEDGWNLANRWFGFGAIVLGAMLGGLAFLAQRNAAFASQQQRPRNERIEAIDARIREIDNQESQLEIEQAKRGAAEADKVSGRAIERAGNAENEAETARLEQVRLNRENLLLQSQLEAEKIERLKLEEKYGPRRLNDSQKKCLTDALIAGSSQGVSGGMIKVDVFVSASDGIPYAMDIIDAINSAPGWKAEFRSQTAIGGTVRGVALIVKNQQSIPPFAVFLQMVLKEQGIGGEGIFNPDMPPDEVELLIAPKL